MYKQLIYTILASVVFGITAGQAFGQSTVKLEYKFQAGQVLHYKVHGKTYCVGVCSNPEDAATVTDGVLELQVAKILPNGDAEMWAGYENGTVRANGQMKSLSAQSVAPAIFKVSKNGVIRDIDNVFKDFGSVSITKASANGNETVVENVYAAMLISILKVYPDRELKIGETWNSLDRFSMFIESKGKLVSLDTKRGLSPVVAVIVTTGDQSETRTFPPTFLPGGVILDSRRVTQRTTLNTNVCFSVSQGCTLSCVDNFSETWSDASSTTTMSTQILLLPERNEK